MNSWRVILATVVIFGSGVLTGGLLVNHVELAPPAHRPHPQEPPLPRPQVMTQQFVEQLDAKLHLTAEQRAKIEKIIANGQERDRDLWKLVAPEFRAVTQDVHQHIRGVLTPDQKKEFEELMKQLAPRRPSPGTNAPAALPPTNAPPESATNTPPPGV